MVAIRRYCAVVARLRCPSGSWMVRRSVPASRRWTANACRLFRYPDCTDLIAQGGRCSGWMSHWTRNNHRLFNKAGPRRRGSIRSTGSLKWAKSSMDMGVALLRRRPRELRRASRQERLDASKAWWGGWRGRLADRRRRPFSVSLGVIPLVFARFVEVPVRVEVAAGP